MPRVRHPDWLGKVVRAQDDSFRQQSVKSMFQGAIDKGAKTVDMEEPACHL